MFTWWSNYIFSADGNYHITTMTKATLFANGLVKWEPPAIFKVRMVELERKIMLTTFTSSVLVWYRCSLLPIRWTNLLAQIWLLDFWRFSGNFPLPIHYLRRGNITELSGIMCSLSVSREGSASTSTVWMQQDDDKINILFQACNVLLEQLTIY